MFKPFLLFAFIFLITVHCSSSSSVKTTSDKIKEFSYEVKGKISIPLNIEIHQLVYLFDLHRQVIDYPNNNEYKEKL